MTSYRKYCCFSDYGTRFFEISEQFCIRIHLPAFSPIVSETEILNFPSHYMLSNFTQKSQMCHSDVIRHPALRHTEICVFGPFWKLQLWTVITQPKKIFLTCVFFCLKAVTFYFLMASSIEEGKNHATSPLTTFSRDPRC